MIFGLWHEGWCSFPTSRNPDRLGYGYSGTEEEARVGKAQFVREGRPASEYQVVLFDHEREPSVRAGKPSPAQLEALKQIELHGRAAPGTFRPTLAAIYIYGWICSNITVDGQEVPGRPMRLTMAGKAFLAIPAP